MHTSFWGMGVGGNSGVPHFPSSNLVALVKMCRRMFVILAAFVLVFFAGVETCMQAYEESDDNSTKWSELYKLTQLRDSICIHEETISLAENWWNGPLTKLYDTAEWDYQMVCKTLIIP